ncbi:organic anion transporter 3 isoform X2 [Ictidomys tridecemlineatus]|uniref:solute carrier family 22 member 8 isoform X2 n=1 Tax=Ictidomys tridecemlineatus TaxID=43179 RepID=UPI001A9D8CA3|nr:solute carrier family 22 member 8 isoform X2 [Ictidomys tridecemlineatus]
MTFPEILDRVGSMGPFQYLHVTLLALPILGMANHNLLQIFTATTPAHHCRPPPNTSAGPWVLPMGPNGEPEKCLRFVHLPNTSLPNDTQGATEPCLDGWVYNTTRDTIVTEVWPEADPDVQLPTAGSQRLRHSLQPHPPLLHSLPLPDGLQHLRHCPEHGHLERGMGAHLDAGHLVDSIWVLLHHWPVHSVRPGLCHPPVALATVNSVCSLLHLLPVVLELKFNLQKDISLAKIKYGTTDLFRIPILRHMTLCLSLAWFSTGFAYYSLAMGVEEFGVNLYILQIIFGGVDIPAKFITILSISYLGRHITQAFVLLLAGGAILALIFVPSDMQILRTALAVFGKGCLSGSFSCLFLYTSELYPTVVRQTGMGINNLWARVGSMLAPLVKITGEVKPFIPNVIYGTMAILGGSAAFFLPETLNRPLPETIEDVQNWRHQGKARKQEPEAEKASQRIPLKPCESGQDPS